MPIARKPANEAERAAALLSSGILATAGEDVWHSFAHLIARQLRLPFAAVSFMSHNKQWFLGTSGHHPRVVMREDSLCSHTIYEGQTLLIPDTRADARTKDLPLLLDDRTIGSYIGSPVRSPDGYLVGTVCALDYTCRDWTDDDRTFIEGVAELATATIATLRLTSDNFEGAVRSDEARIWDVKANLFDNVAEISNTGGWSLDLETDELYWTQQTKRILELPLDTVPNLIEALKFYDPDIQRVVTEAVMRCRKEGVPWDLELPMKTATGRKIWVHSKGEAEYRDGKPFRLIGSFQDVTDLKKQQEELQAARYSESHAKRNLSLYLSALEQHSVLIVTNTEGRVTFANDKFCKISGYSASELIGGTLGKLNSHIHSQRFYLDMRETIKSGRAWHGEVCNRRKDGSLFWLDSTIVPRLADDGSLSDCVNICFDITDWVNHRNALEKERLEAQDATSAKNRFLASMSHEIRTPLNGVVALAGALANTQLSDEQREMVELILKSGEGLNVILSDILDLSRIEEGVFNVQSAPFNFARCIETVVGLLQISVDEKGLDINVSIPSDLDGYFMGDDVRIRQVVSNLLSNAVKFTDSGRIDIESEIVGQTEDGLRVRTSVKDTGVGMSPSEVARVFHRFEQGDTSLSRSHSGVGLGLWICAQLCEIMGGRIWVESEIGVGSCFVFDLPLTPVDTSVVDELVADEKEPEPLPAGMRVLLAEDHVVNQRVFSLILSAAGFELEIVDNGEKAFERWMEDDFAFVLMDLQMPRVDGLMAIRMIRDHEVRFGLEKTPIAALSANAMDEHKVASRDAGADMHISKPVTPEELLEGITRLVRMKSTANSQTLGAKRGI